MFNDPRRFSTVIWANAPVYSGIVGFHCAKYGIQRNDALALSQQPIKQTGLDWTTLLWYVAVLGFISFYLIHIFYSFERILLCWADDAHLALINFNCNVVFCPSVEHDFQNYGLPRTRNNEDNDDDDNVLGWCAVAHKVIM